MDAEHLKIDSSKLLEPLSRSVIYEFTGKVNKAIGLTLEASLPGAAVGSVCEIDLGLHSKPILAEVIGFRGSKVVLMPLEE
ncbi:MAG: flagellum-specific ATP synthase FliI, partial [Oligoflexia bacterium]|nr:flagellum-specific ATP synthase FliI [Oligoflexia bacterium]